VDLFPAFGYSQVGFGTYEKSTQHFVESLFLECGARKQEIRACRVLHTFLSASLFAVYNENVMSTLFNVFAGIVAGFISLFGSHAPAQQPVQQVGATIPIATSFYNDSLQSGITATQNSFTMVSGKDAEGNSLNGEYGFVIDQGTAVQEIVLCTTVSGVSASGCTRGIDLTTGTSSVASLEFVHNRGASVQITTAPVVNIIDNILRGVDVLEQPITYDSTVSTSSIASNVNNLASVGLVNFVGTTGCANATTGVRGCIQLSTSIQTASSTASGSSGAALAIPTTEGTSTPGYSCNSSGTIGALCIPVALNDGKLSPTWFNGTGENYTFNGTTTFSQGFVSQASSTFSSSVNLNGTVTFANYTFLSIYGTATDASTTLDGTVTVSWAIKSGSTYTLLRDVNTTNLTIASGVTLKTNNFKISGTGTLNNVGVIDNSGVTGLTNGNTTTATTTGSMAPELSGGAGGSPSSSATTGTAGTNSTHTLGGIGSAGGTGSNTGTGGATSTISAVNVSPDLLQALYMVDGGGTTLSLYEGGSGGAGGGGGGNTVGWYGGSGGTGGGIVFLAFPTIKNSGTISANGGTGGAGQGSSLGGGGGGGGGGSIVIVTKSHTNTGSETVNGGSGGTGNKAGNAGSVGNIFIVQG
jgi:hypothetical protein